MAAGFGVVGYCFRRFGCDPAPLMLGLALGPMMEENFRRTLVIADGEFTVFFTRPISASLLFLALLMVVMLALPAVRRKQRERSEEHTSELQSLMRISSAAFCLKQK